MSINDKTQRIVTLLVEMCFLRKNECKIREHGMTLAKVWKRLNVKRSSFSESTIDQRNIIYPDFKVDQRKIAD